MQKTTYASLVVGSVLMLNTLSAQNSIYVDQITTSGTTNLIQVGSNNTIGTAQLSSDLQGDNLTFEMRQIGNGNNTLFSIINANNMDFLTVVEGELNSQRIYMNGASNNLNALFQGDSNSLLINGDTTVDATGSLTTKSTFAFSDVLLDVEGDSNDLKFGISGGLYNYVDYTITGNSNSVRSVQIGNPAGNAAKSGHEQDVTITGNSNSLFIYQAGLEKQLFNYNLTGSNTNVQIVQTTLGYEPVMTTSGGPAGPAQNTSSIQTPGGP